MIPCLPKPEALNPSIDEVDKLVEYFKKWCSTENIELNPLEEEYDDRHLKYFLRINNFDVTKSKQQWIEWIKWRHSVEASSITDEDIADEVNCGLATWKGRDKSGRPCLIITGRMLQPGRRKGGIRSFQKFMIKTVEDGLKLADSLNQPEVCILYDRRGLDFSHMDPILHQLSQRTIHSLKSFYGKRLGAVYILHLNWFFNFIYKNIIQPILDFTAVNQRFMIFETSQDLLKVFDEDQIFLKSESEMPPLTIVDDSTQHSVSMSAESVSLQEFHESNSNNKNDKDSTSLPETYGNMER